MYLRCDERNPRISSSCCTVIFALHCVVFSLRLYVDGGGGNRGASCFDGSVPRGNLPYIAGRFFVQARLASDVTTSCFDIPDLLWPFQGPKLYRELKRKGTTNSFWTYLQKHLVPGKVTTSDMKDTVSFRHPLEHIRNIEKYRRHGVVCS
jgi:hypothetical protein